MMSTFEEILQFGRKNGFEIHKDKVLLPLGVIEDWEYGVAVRGREDRIDRLYKGSPYAHAPRAYVKKGANVKFGGKIECYALETIIRTVELKGTNYTTDVRKTNAADKRRGLIVAARLNRGFNTFDAKFQLQARKEILGILPRDVTGRLVSQKADELAEKMAEVEQANIPYAERIMANLADELAYCGGRILDYGFRLDEDSPAYRVFQVSLHEKAENKTIRNAISLPARNLDDELCEKAMAALNDTKSITLDKLRSTSVPKGLSFDTLKQEERDALFPPKIARKVFKEEKYYYCNQCIYFIKDGNLRDETLRDAAGTAYENKDYTFFYKFYHKIADKNIKKELWWREFATGFKAGLPLNIILDFNSLVLLWPSYNIISDVLQAHYDASTGLNAAIASIQVVGMYGMTRIIDKKSRQ